MSGRTLDLFNAVAANTPELGGMITIVALAVQLLPTPGSYSHFIMS
jgi:hypothetical protein